MIPPCQFCHFWPWYDCQEHGKAERARVDAERAIEREKYLKQKAAEESK